VKGGRGIPVPDHLVDEWPVWRGIHAGYFTMLDALTADSISLKDVDDVNDVLDIYQRAAEIDTK